MADRFSDPMMEEEAQRQDPRRRPRMKVPTWMGRGWYIPGRVGKNKPQSTESIQRMLKAKGYKIGKVDGVYGPLTKSAYNAYANGRDSERWNARHRRARPVVPRGPSGAGGGGGGPVGPAPVEDPYAQPDQFGGVPEVDTGGTNTSRLLPRSMADTLAGAQFDPQIQELLSQIQRGGRDTEQHQRDIGGWYGQVRGAQETARTRDQEAGQQARTSVQSALQGIIESLGGSRGAGVVGAAGLNDLTALAAQGASQDRYNADMQPLLAAEEAGQHSRESAMASQRRNALDTAMVSAKGQRGQAKAKALMEIIAANNQGRQQNFQNRLAVQNARMAGASLGLNADQAYAGIENARANQRLNERKMALTEKMSLQEMRQRGGGMTWKNLNYPDRQTVVHDAVGRAMATMAPDHWDERYVKDRALKVLLSGGFQAARGANYRGKVNKQSQRQIQAAVDSAVRAAYVAWKAKQGG